MQNVTIQSKLRDRGEQFRDERIVGGMQQTADPHYHILLVMVPLTCSTSW